MQRQTETEAETTEIYSKHFLIYNCCNTWLIMYIHMCPVPMADYYFSFNFIKWLIGSAETGNIHIFKR